MNDSKLPYQMLTKKLKTIQLTYCPTQSSYGGAHFNFPNLFNQKIYCNVFFFL